MIQRIQTVFLFVIALAMGAVSLVPIWAAKNPEGTKMAKLWAHQLVLKEGDVETSLANPMLIMALSILAALVAVFSITQFKNRMLQMKLGMVNSILIGGTLIASVYYMNVALSNFEAETLQGGYKIGFWLPLVAVISNFFANRFIRRDERLVKSADRLR